MTPSNLGRDRRLVIGASAVGTVFEWYDFYIYGTLASLLGTLFFPAGNAAAGVLLALATFGIGFAVRPVGAVVFGYLGDRLGRKYTFIVTITLMGAATAGIGMIGDYAQIGIAAPILLVTLRAVQGFALGGEYGGAAIYVAEHAPAKRRGLHTGFVQIGSVAGFVAGLLVVIITSSRLGPAAWIAWGWRLPFLFSLPLLAVSLLVRFKLSESPIFQEMKSKGAVARNPVAEAFNSLQKLRRLALVMLGVVGQALGAFVAFFSTAGFLQTAQHLDPTLVRVMLMIAAAFGVPVTLISAALSDRFGRKPLIAAGYVLLIVGLFPIFHALAWEANPDLARAMRVRPVVVAGSDCRYDPIDAEAPRNACTQILTILSKKGVAYRKVAASPDVPPSVSIGGKPVNAADPRALDIALRDAGYSFSQVHPPLASVMLLTTTLIGLFSLSAIAYGPMAAWLVELFPARIRYTSLSVPYHLGIGYFSGFLPFIVQYLVAKTGDPFAGFWYPSIGVAISLAAALSLPETSGRRLN